MTELWQQVLSGLGSGFIYASLALAICLVFQGTGAVNFAQGVMATASAYLAWSLVSNGMNFWLALVLVLAASFVLGALIERVFIRPVEGSSPLVMLTVTVALLIGLQAVVALIWGDDPQQLQSPFGGGSVEVFGARLTAQQLGAAAVVLVTLLLAGAFFRFTTLGLRMRAAAQNPASARLLSIDVGRMLALGWGLAATVGAVAGVIFAPTLGVSPAMMDSSLLLALAAATLGGFESRGGAVVGGLVLGVAANLASRYIPGIGSDLQLVVPFAVIFLVLLLRPQGLFGRVSSVRA
ncbi:branched-chain amino acid ABC transporter permease [Blastococcus haudaquaticus]|uniref:Amino acid/amide ABC transporter membrane protein 1, HAAT family n=1 Tax=Blastococcus haudaquaticus TaxID=1938745 RepID=A0A286GQE2_9ACTN|nr:branched-chain amino acid ABC transporter permease [Blastococcus haudaquaticus]SOD97765.1 amino acid/amide ABC transporter membrane protein 1, HAAT family [Blastococcus haudaquaticus]